MGIVFWAQDRPPFAAPCKPDEGVETPPGRDAVKTDRSGTPRGSAMRYAEVLHIDPARQPIVLFLDNFLAPVHKESM